MLSAQDYTHLQHNVMLAPCKAKRRVKVLFLQIFQPMITIR